MSPTYNQEQTTFFFSMLTNLAGTMTGTPDQIEQYVAGRLDLHLQDSVPQIGPWHRVWGPAVFQAPLSNVADNVMYVVASDFPPAQLVVAIAGTNTASAFDVLIEDLFVEKQVAWEYGKPPGESRPRISVGTFLGLTALQFMTPGPGIAGANQRLDAFLAGAVSGPLSVTVTGHSLGGTLSVALALWLRDVQAAWDPAARATICCQPSAALTAGNADFAAYYDQALGSRTTRIYNSLDTVPHYWNEAELSLLPDVYAPTIEPDLVIDALVATARAAASGGNYTQIARTTPALRGTIQTSIIDPDAFAFENYLKQAGYQHVDEYLTLMGITMSQDTLAAIRDVMGAPAAARAAARLRARLRHRQAIPAQFA